MAYTSPHAAKVLPKRYLGLTGRQFAVLMALMAITCFSTALVAMLLYNSAGHGNPLLALSGARRPMVGEWEMVVTAQKPGVSELRLGCHLDYPKRIVFYNDQTYTGEAIGEFTYPYLWQLGDYKIIEPDRIEIKNQFTNAAYTYQVDGDRLTLRDTAACEIFYQRVK